MELSYGFVCHSFQGHSLKKFFFMFIYFWERERQSANGGGAERGRHRIWTRLQAPGSELSAQSLMGAQTHRLWDHDLSQSQLLNWLSHPDGPQGHSNDTGVFQKIKTQMLSGFFISNCWWHLPDAAFFTAQKITMWFEVLWSIQM